LQQFKQRNLLHPVYFFKNNEVEPSAQHLLVQHGNCFCGFVLYDKEKKHVNTWVLYETKSGIDELLLANIVQQQDWLKSSFQSILIVDYTERNTLLPKTFVKADTAIMELMIGSSQHTVSMEDAAGDAVNLYQVPSAAYIAVNRFFTNARWLHHESLVIEQPASEEAVITVEIWFNTIFIHAEKNGKWLLLQQRNYQTPEDVLYYILNCRQQWQMGEEVLIQLQGMVEEKSALYNLMYQYFQKLELQKELLYYFPSNTTDIPPHTKTLIDRILTCVS
jgi:Protein of unknown function (DUF3822)